MINYLAPEGEYCPTLEDIAVAREVAEYLEIPFFSFDYIHEYQEKVLNYMYEGYQRGITPNPDVMCNSEIKFKVFLDEALALGFDGVATGHYARIVSTQIPTLLDEKGGEGFETSEVFHLLKWVDPEKDQSYFLSGLSQSQLSHTLFPIGGMLKSEVRELARQVGLPNAQRKDSQGICFVGKVDFMEFLEKKIAPVPWKVVDTSGKVLGEHKWVFYYTIGQRKGLDIGGQKEPIFVVAKDLVTNTITVGTQADRALYGGSVKVKDFHFLAPCSSSFPLKATAKIRYRQADQACEIFKLQDGYEVVFENPQRAISPWQILAWYQGEELVASGVME